MWLVIARELVARLYGIGTRYILGSFRWLSLDSGWFHNCKTRPCTMKCNTIVVRSLEKSVRQCSTTLLRWFVHDKTRVIWFDAHFNRHNLRILVGNCLDDWRSGSVLLYSVAARLKIGHSKQIPVNALATKMIETRMWLDATMQSVQVHVEHAPSYRSHAHSHEITNNLRAPIFRFIAKYDWSCQNTSKNSLEKYTVNIIAWMLIYL